MNPRNDNERQNIQMGLDFLLSQQVKPVRQEGKRPNRPGR